MDFYENHMNCLLFQSEMRSFLCFQSIQVVKTHNECACFACFLIVLCLRTNWVFCWNQLDPQQSGYRFVQLLDSDIYWERTFTKQVNCSFEASHAQGTKIFVRPFLEEQAVRFLNFVLHQDIFILVMHRTRSQQKPLFRAANRPVMSTKLDTVGCMGCLLAWWF